MSALKPFERAALDQLADTEWDDGTVAAGREAADVMRRELPDLDDCTIGRAVCLVMAFAQTVVSAVPQAGADEVMDIFVSTMSTAALELTRMERTS